MQIIVISFCSSISSVVHISINPRFTLLFMFLLWLFTFFHKFTHRESQWVLSAILMLPNSRQSLLNGCGIIIIFSLLTTSINISMGTRLCTWIKVSTAMILRKFSWTYKFKIWLFWIRVRYCRSSLSCLVFLFILAILSFLLSQRSRIARSSLAFKLDIVFVGPHNYSGSLSSITTSTNVVNGYTKDHEHHNQA